MRKLATIEECCPQLLTAPLDEAAEPVINLRDLTPDAGSALVEASYDISPGWMSMAPSA